LIISEEEHVCPCCGGTLHRRDKRQRIHKLEGGKRKWYIINRLWDACCLDNGTQYTSDQLHAAYARLGIRVLHAKPRACESKGKIEKFHQKVDQFIAEIRVAHVHYVEELNRKWKVFMEQDYQKGAHDGIREYYELYGAEVPAAGITPLQEL